MKKLAYILAIIAICINDVSEHGNGAVFTGCVFMGMGFVALGCMAAETIRTIREDE